jgi:pimeloyl-ACP methyl ester carboxylesterase
MYREAIQVRHVSNTALEYYRWMIRSLARPSGIRYFKRMQQPVAAPTLQLHGSLDTSVLPRTALGSGRYVGGTYEWRQIDGVGHFLPEEAPDVVSAEILRWAKGS